MIVAMVYFLYLLIVAPTAVKFFNPRFLRAVPAVVETAALDVRER
jgi:hypothetical protein